MPPCKHHEICGREALEGTKEDLCILHSQDPKKDKKSFDEALAEHRKGKGDDFRYFVFAGDTNFRNFVFAGRADFSGSEFGGEANFQEAKFQYSADFSRSSFLGPAVFFEAVFNEDADFAHADFNNGAFFSDSKFLTGAKFFGAAFTKGAKFSKAEFTRWAYFGLAKFNGWTSFANTTFTEGASFSDAEFMTSPSFFDAKFMGDAAFEGATFTGGADFSGAVFREAVEFFRARFLGRTLFLSGQVEGRTIPIFSGTLVSFRDVAIVPLDALTFRDADLQKCFFVGTDLRKTEFVNVTWNQIVSKRWPKIESRSGVYDEVDAEQKGARDKYPHIEQIYRQLKQDYEDRKDYERAGDFHYGEKEMRRKNPETPLGRWLLLWLYWLVSGYGERYLRPAIWAAGLLVVCAVLYLFLGLHPKNGGAALAWTSLGDWLRSAFYSFRVMTLLRPDDLAPVGYAKLVHAFESLVGPLIIGLFGLAVRQRLKR